MIQILLKMYLIAVILLVLLSCSDKKGADIKNGDIIFQISKSSQGTAIELATKSKYTHVGIIFYKDGVPYVLEAVQPVKYTMLNDWIDRGQDNHYVVKRLKESILNSTAIDSMIVLGKKMLGKNYDIYFEWTDDRLYCSELVWKLYHGVLSVELCDFKKLGEFDLSHPVVKSKLIERHGDSIPLEEPVISPGDLFNSEKLKTIISK